MAIKVKLRQKPISGKRHSLYLDFYPAIKHPETGESTRREFLRMYVHAKVKTTFEKTHNKETLQIAEEIRQKRENNENKPEIYTGYEKEQLKIKTRGEKNFVEYFKELTDKRTDSNHESWKSAYRYLVTFTNGHLQFSELNDKFCKSSRNIY